MVHSRTRRVRRVLGLGVLLLSASGYQACFVSIAPPAQDLTGLAGGTSMIASGGIAGSSFGGASGAAAGDASGGRWSGGGVGAGTSGGAPAGVGGGSMIPHGTGSCLNGACLIETCDAGWASCDGDPNNGCELKFAESVITAASPLAIGPVSSPPKLAEWAALPYIRIDELCRNCNPNQPGGIPNEPKVTAIAATPAALDLSAYFRLGYSPAGLHLQAFIQDDELKLNGQPLQQDALVVLLDGKNDDQVYGADDHDLVIGMSGMFIEPDRNRTPMDVIITTTPVGTTCYRVEATLSWTYISGINGGPNTPPAANAKLGFSIGASDWDQGERQSLLFWKSPGMNYGFRTEGFADIQVVP